MSKRDKTKKSLKQLIETVNEDEFKNDWCSDNALDLDELSLKYNASTRNIERFASYFGFKRSKAFMYNKVKNTCLERYGVPTTLKNPETKNKIAQTNMQKYGAENPFANKEIQEKIKQTNLKKYGVEYVQMKPEIRAKSFQTCIKRYGSKNNIEKIKQTNLKKYGGSNINKSVKNVKFEDLLNERNISFEREFPIKSYSYDFKIDNNLIEIHGDHTIDPQKSEAAKENGFQCIHVFPWDDPNKIANLFIGKQKIYARNCEIKEVQENECDEFLNNYHLQNTCKGQKIKIGLYYNSELIELMTFGKPRYNKKYEFELLRLCSKTGYIIIGGSQKLFNYFIKTYSPKNIISYCDLSKFSGNVYDTLGFKLSRKNKPSCHWVNLKTNQHITDNLLRQHGFDQLFSTSYGKEITNEELMKANNFVSIYDCGQATFVYNC